LFASILAATESDLPKIIFGLIFFVIWALSALVSWLNKKQQEAKRERVRQEIERATRRGAPQPVRQQPQRRREPARIAEGIAQRFPDVLLPPSPPSPPPRIPQSQERRPVPPTPVRRPPKQPQSRRHVSVAPPPLPALFLESAPAQPYVNITQPAARAQAPTVDAKAVRHWLSPATLRHQFILTEILQPPLALRPDPHDRA
jgi:hypothetical protein